MANALTKQIMATIVERCEGYKPMKAAEPAQAAGLSAAKTSGGSSGNPLNQREEALLSKIIHKQTAVAVEQNVDQRRTAAQAAKAPEARPVSLKETAAFKRDGVVSLDALIKEIKR